MDVRSLESGRVLLLGWNKNRRWARSTWAPNTPSLPISGQNPGHTRDRAVADSNTMPFQLRQNTRSQAPPRNFSESREIIKSFSIKHKCYLVKQTAALRWPVSSFRFRPFHFFHAVFWIDFPYFRGCPSEDWTHIVCNLQISRQMSLTGFCTNMPNVGTDSASLTDLRSLESGRGLLLG